MKIRQRADADTAALLEAVDRFAETYGLMIGQWSGGATPGLELVSVVGKPEPMFACMRALSKKFEKIKDYANLGVLVITWPIGGVPVGRVLAATPENAKKLAEAISK